MPHSSGAVGYTVGTADGEADGTGVGAPVQTVHVMRQQLSMSACHSETVSSTHLWPLEIVTQPANGLLTATCNII